MRSATGAAVLLVTAAVLIFWQAPFTERRSRDGAAAGSAAPVPVPPASPVDDPTVTSATPTTGSAGAVSLPPSGDLPGGGGGIGGASGIGGVGGTEGTGGSGGTASVSGAAAPGSDANAAAAGSTADVAPLPPSSTVLVLGSVFFPSNRRTLGPDATRMLEGIAATYKGTAQRLEIVGHADARGSAAANLTLSAGRAEAVRAFLAAQGVPEANMQVLYDGARTPMARGVDPEANAQNRRVEIRLPRQ